MSDERPHRPHPSSSAAVATRHYRFFGQAVRVMSDRTELLAVLDQIYARQRMPTGGAPDITVHVRADAGRIQIGPRSVRVPDPTQLEHFAHLVLVNVAGAAAKDRTVLHAGAVAYDGRAVLLVGRSGWGKTTHTLALAARGWGLLSDDFAPLAADGRVLPFARRLNLTDRTVELLGIDVPADTLRLTGFGGRSKWMLDPETLFPGQLAGPTPLGAVFLLSRQPDTAPTDPSTWHLQLDELPPDLLPALAAIPGVRRVRRSPSDSETRAPTGPQLKPAPTSDRDRKSDADPVVTKPNSPGAAQAIASREDSGPTTIKLETHPGARVVAALDAVCARYDTSVLSATAGSVTQPEFAGRPQLTQVEPAELLPELLAHDLALSGRRFLEGTEPTAVRRAYRRLAGVIALTGAQTYRLVPGELGATVERVVAATRGSSPTPTSFASTDTADNGASER